MTLMPNPYTHTDLLEHALIGLEHRKEEITQVIARLRSVLDGAGPTRNTTALAPKRGTMSAATRNGAILNIAGHVEVEHGDLDHTPEAVEVWAAELALRFGGRPIAVALEQSRGSLLFMLTKYAHLVLFPVHPTTLYDYRKGFRPSGA
jgi:hypothetical protein